MHGEPVHSQDVQADLSCAAGDDRAVRPPPQIDLSRARRMPCRQPRSPAGALSIVACALASGARSRRRGCPAALATIACRLSAGPRACWLRSSTATRSSSRPRAPAALRVLSQHRELPPDAPLLTCLGRYPLVLFLHGQCPQSPPNYQSWFRLPATLARSGFVVVVPDLGWISGQAPWQTNVRNMTWRWMWSTGCAPRGRAGSG